MSTTADSEKSLTPPSSTAGHDRMILLLAIVGGSVGAIIFLGFGALREAQTGNTIHLNFNI